MAHSNTSKGQRSSGADMTTPPVVGSPSRARLHEEAMVKNGYSARRRRGSDYGSDGNR